MRALTALFLIGLMASPALAFDRPTRPTAAPPGTGPVTRPLVNAPTGMSGNPTTSASALRVLPATEAPPDDFMWKARPLVIFADTAAEPHFTTQLRLLEALPGPLLDRNVVVITDTDPEAASEWRQRLHPRGFSLVLLDTDGRVVIRKPLPWDTREIARSIDKLPSRRDELRGRQGAIR